ncbi:hypothetical protein LCGC14_2146480 [marine sediment metagenome]|uniref:HNH nuclease domain-containing protein n=1 Tax=marine sediment metagenome TaxID=412755 RepID=A0A0F9DWS9_9ZZZZ
MDTALKAAYAARKRLGSKNICTTRDKYFMINNYGEIPENHHIHHIDGNPKNNDIGDIAYSISLSWNVAQDVNPTYDVPYYFSYPNLKLRPIMRFPSVQMTTSKVWLKLGTAKYRLTVYGRFCKWTNKQVKVGGTYIEGTYNYVPFYEEVTPGEWQGWYKLDTFTETTRNINVYEPEYHPSNVRLLVNYVNNSGQNEVRKYSL